MKFDLHTDPQSLGKVAVLFGGYSAERPVSLMSGQGVLAALQSIGVDAHPFDPAVQPLQALKDQGFERAFIALHGRGGEDGTIQGALEWLAIPYTGSGVMASSLAMDKTATKRLWSSESLPTPQWLAFSKAELTRECVRSIPDALGLPVIVKPPHEGSSIGISKAKGYSDMQSAVELALGFDDELLFEQCIEGPELTCAVLGEGEAAQALPVVEIRAVDGNYDYENKYITNSTEYLFGTPARHVGSRDPATRAARLPHARLPRLGPCRPDAEAERQQALPARDEHQPRHDLALAGAQGGSACRHRLPAALPVAAGPSAGWTAAEP